MSSIENKIVGLQFDNKQFQQAMAQTMAQIEQMKTATQNFNSNQGFAGLQASANAVNLSNISSQVDQINSKFSALGAIAFTVLQRIGNTAMDAGGRLMSGLMGPLIQGGMTRSLQIEQARFGFEGLGQDVEASMQSALDAVRGTAYGLGEAATIAQLFGASGIEAGSQMTGALRGVAGVAAMTGRSFSEIGQVYQNVAGIGHLTNNDLNSFAVRGLNAAKILGDQMGLTELQVREMATNSEISFEQFAMAMDDALGEHATKANETFKGSMANLKAAMSRIGADFFTSAFAGLRKVFNALSPAIDTVHEALMPLLDAFDIFARHQGRNLADWIKGLDFSDLFDTLSHLPAIFNNTFRAIKAILAPVRDAFRDIFPSDGVNTLQAIMMSIQRFTANLKISGTTAHTVRNIFRGIFSVFSIGWGIIKGVASVFSSLFGAISGGESSLLNLAGGIGKAVWNFQKLLVEGGALEDFFNTVGDWIADFVNAIQDTTAVRALTDALKDLGRWLGNLFGSDVSADAEALGSGFDRAGQRIEMAREHGERFRQFLSTLGTAIRGYFNDTMAMIDNLMDKFSGFFDSIKESFNNGNFSEITDALNIGLIGAIGLAFNQMLRGGVNLNVMSSLVFQLKNMFNEVRITLVALQMEVKARALMKIAQAVALLTVSLVALSLIDSASLTKALAATAVGMGQLVGTMTLLTHGPMGPAAMGKLAVASQAMIAIAGALVIFSIAVGILGTMELETLAKGLGAAAISLTLLALAGKAMQGSIGGAFAMGIMAASLILMAGAVGLFGSMEVDTLVKGLAGIAGVFVVIGLAGLALGPVIPQIAALGIALIPLAIGLGLLGAAVAIFSAIGLDNLVTGLIGFAGVLAVLGIATFALQTVIPQMFLLGIALMPLALGLMAMAVALGMFAVLGLEGIAAGLLGVVGALAILGAGALLLTNVIPQIALLGLALVPMAIGLIAIATAIKVFSEMGLHEVALGLLAIIAALAIFGAGALLLTPVTPALAALGAALIVVAGAFALFGAGAYLTALALSTIAELGPRAWDAIMDGLGHAITLLPELAKQFAEGLLAFVDVIVDAIPGILEGFWQIMDAIFNAIIEYAPTITKAIVAIIDLILTVINEKGPDIMATGMMLLIQLLQGIQDNIGQITTMVSQIIINFLTALTEKVPELVEAGHAFLRAWLQGVGANIAGVVTAAGQVIVGFLNGLAANMGPVVTAGVNLIVAFLNGVANNIQRIITAGSKIIQKFIEGIGREALNIATSAADTIVEFLRGLESSIRAKSDEIRNAAGGIGDAILDGIWEAIDEGKDALLGRVTGLGGSLVDGFMGAIGANSPSKEFIKAGGYIIDGLAVGLANDSAALEGVATLGNNVMTKFGEVVSAIDTELYTTGALNPVITPVLDLTNVSGGARQLSSMFGNTQLSASVSTAQAKDISKQEARRRSDSAPQQEAVAAGPTQITFEQHNYARDELSLEELYRNTKSQFVLATEELGI